MKLVKSLLLGSAAGLDRRGRSSGSRSPREGQSGRIREDLLPVRSRVSTTSRALTPASSWVVTCALKSRWAPTRVYTGQHQRRLRCANNRLTQLLHHARSREDLNIDTRTATEYGVVRTFFDATFSWTTGSYGANGASPGCDRCTHRSAAAARLLRLRLRTTRARGTVPAVRSASTTPSSSSPASRWVRRCRSSRRPGPNYPGNNFDGLVGGGGTVTGVNQFTYTADFGQGVYGRVCRRRIRLPTTRLVSSTSALEPDRLRHWRRSACSVLATIGGSRSRTSSLWCVLTRLGVCSRHRSLRMTTTLGYYGATELTGHPDDKWGWAGAAGFVDQEHPDWMLATRSTSRASTPTVRPATTIQDLAGAAGASTDVRWHEPGRRLPERRLRHCA